MQSVGHDKCIPSTASMVDRRERKKEMLCEYTQAHTHYTADTISLQKPLMAGRPTHGGRSAVYLWRIMKGENKLWPIYICIKRFINSSKWSCIT